MAINRFLVEEFNEAYQVSKRSISTWVALLGSPTFGQLKLVTEFTDDEKSDYIKELRTREYIASVRRVAVYDPFAEFLDNQVEFAEDGVPDYILRVAREMSA